MTLRVPLTSLGAWIFSMVVHASGVCVAVILAAEFSVVPQFAPFRWDVTLVAASRPEESSGHDTLDHDAIALLERISPMQLQYSLEQPFIVVRIPIGYRLE